VTLQRRQGFCHRLQQWLLRDCHLHDLEVVRDAPSSRAWRRRLLDPAQLLLDHSGIGRGALIGEQFLERRQLLRCQILVFQALQSTKFHISPRLFFGGDYRVSMPSMANGPRSDRRKWAERTPFPCLPSGSTGSWMISMGAWCGMDRRSAQPPGRVKGRLRALGRLIAPWRAHGYAGSAPCSLVAGDARCLSVPGYRPALPCHARAA